VRSDFHDALNKHVGKLERAATPCAFPSRLIVWLDENHRIFKVEDSRYWYLEVYAWLKKYLGEQRPA
jgi:dipeptidyl aminopeptidase/acylaminoacyl peptidase